MNFVIDASVIAKWFLTDEPRQAQAQALLDAAVGGRVDLVAPSLALYEVGNALMQRRGETLTARSLTALAGVEISWLSPETGLLVLASEMAADHSLTFYDASYLACALAHRAPLVSDDRALVNAAMDEGFGIALERLQLPADG